VPLRSTSVGRSGSAQSAPSWVQQRTTSRIDSTPTRSPPSQTARWRPSAVHHHHRGQRERPRRERRTISERRWPTTRSWAGSRPRASETRMSCSVTIPGPAASGSSTRQLRVMDRHLRGRGRRLGTRARNRPRTARDPAHRFRQ
jgi:hypothetical protein